MNFPAERRNCGLLVMGGTISYLGDLIFLMAINLWVSRVAQGPELLGLVTGVGSLALFLGNPLGGYLADRFDKKVLLVGTDILSTLAVLMVCASYDSQKIDLLPLLAGNIILSLCFSFYSPTSRALAPIISAPENLHKLNSYLSITGEIVKLTAPALGGLLLSSNLIGERLLILLNAISFLISAVMNACLSIPQRQIEVTQSFSSEAGFEHEGLIGGYKSAWKALGNQRWALVPICLVNFFSGGLTVLLPFLAKNEGAFSYPSLLLAEAVGAFAGGVFSSRLKSTFALRSSFFLLLAAALALSLLNTSFHPAVHLVALVAFGFCLAIFNVNFFTLIQSSISANFVGRTFGLIFTSASALVPIGNILFSQLGALLPAHALTLAGLGMLVSVGVLLAPVFSENTFRLTAERTI